MNTYNKRAVHIILDIYKNEDMLNKLKSSPSPKR
jgi:hypothetical protein